MMDKAKRLLKDKFTPILCACFIVILETIALFKGIDGITLSLAIGGLTGIGGYTIRGFTGK